MEKLIGLLIFVFIATFIIEATFGKARKSKGIEKLIWFIFAVAIGITFIAAILSK